MLYQTNNSSSRTNKGKKIIRTYGGNFEEKNWYTHLDILVEETSVLCEHIFFCQKVATHQPTKMAS